jgi:hypothetical protein
MITVRDLKAELTNWPKPEWWELEEDTAAPPLAGPTGPADDFSGGLPFPSDANSVRLRGYSSKKRRVCEAGAAPVQH